MTSAGAWALSPAAVTRSGRRPRYPVTQTCLPVPLDPETIATVRTSWAEIAPRAARLGARFYDTLFSADPSLVALFGANDRGAMLDQGGKLMQTLGAAVAALDAPASLERTLRALGRRHAAYGVADAHYGTVEAALLRTLGEGLGDRFTPDVEQAWAALYQVVVSAMIAGAHEAAPPDP